MGLTPILALIVGEHNVTTIAQRHQTITGLRDIEQHRSRGVTGRQRCTLQRVLNALDPQEDDRTREKSSE